MYFVWKCGSATVLIALFMTSLCQGAPADEAIRQIVASYMEARNHQDVAALRKLFTQDADQMVSTGVWRHGLDNLLKGAMASSKKENGQSTITVESIRMITPDVALTDGRYETASAAGVRKMWSSFVLKHGSDGAWRITAIRNMLPAAN